MNTLQISSKFFRVLSPASCLFPVCRGATASYIAPPPPSPPRPHMIFVFSPLCVRMAMGFHWYCLPSSQAERLPQQLWACAGQETSLCPWEKALSEVASPILSSNRSCCLHRDRTALIRYSITQQQTVDPIPWCALVPVQLIQRLDHTGAE